MNHDDDRPLSGISSAELALRLERLRGEMWKEITRIDGTLLSQERDAERRWQDYQRALGIFEKELARRLEVLNSDREEAKDVLHTYITRDVYERDKKEGESRLNFLETSAANLAGKLWLPLAAMMAVVAALVTVAVKVLFP